MRLAGGSDRGQHVRQGFLAGGFRASLFHLFDELPRGADEVASVEQGLVDRGGNVGAYLRVFLQVGEEFLDGGL
jgi:hypothetical protein